MRNLTLFDMALFDRLKVGMFGCHNDTTTIFQQRQTLTMNLRMYNLSFLVNTLTTSCVGFRFTSSETDAEPGFPRIFVRCVFADIYLINKYSLFGKNFENFGFLKIPKPPFNLCTVTWISYHRCK